MKKLKAYVPDIAKILELFDGPKTRGVEKFRNDVQIMIATDAGGESINTVLWQMINCDIPWNQIGGTTDGANSSYWSEK